MNEWQLLKGRLKAQDADDLTVQHCWNVAKDAIDRFVKTGTVPASVYTEAVLRAGQSVYQATKATNGIAGYDGQSTPVFVAKDPMTTVYPLLRPYVGWF